MKYDGVGFGEVELFLEFLECVVVQLILAGYNITHSNKNMFGMKENKVRLIRVKNQ